MAIGQNVTLTQKAVNNAPNGVNWYYQTTIGNLSVEKVVDSNAVITDPKDIYPGVIINRDNGYNT